MNIRKFYEADADRGGGSHPPTSQGCAMQKLILQIKGCIQLIDEHGNLNDYAQSRKEVYQSILDVAEGFVNSTSPLTSEDIRQMAEAKAKELFPIIAGETLFNSQRQLGCVAGFIARAGTAGKVSDAIEFYDWWEKYIKEKEATTDHVVFGELINLSTKSKYALFRSPTVK